MLLFFYLFFVIVIHNFVAGEGELSPAFAVKCLLSLLLLAVICPIILRKGRTFRVALKEETASEKKDRLWIPVFFLLSFGVLLRWFLSYYPGAFSTDAVYQYEQALSGRYNDWKPILQTLITFTLPVRLTGRVDSIVFFQIAEYSAALTYMAYVILKRSNKWIAIGSLSYILVNPVTGNMVICPWKDVTFAIFAVLLMTFGLQIFATGGGWLERKRNLALLGAALLIATIVRHNGFLFTIPFLVAVLVHLKRKRRIWFLIFFAAGIVLIRGPVYAGLEVEEQWNHKTRVLGAPMAMLGTVVREAPELLGEEAQEFVYRVAPREVWEEVFHDGGFSSIKWQSDQTVVEEAGIRKVLLMAADALARAPGPALKGLFELTDMVYAIDSNFDWYIIAQVDENDVGVEYRQFCDRYVLEKYTEVSRNGVFKYIFWYLGVLNIIIIAGLSCKCCFKTREGWKRGLFGLSVLCYNFGTMLLLSGNDFRYFYFNFPVFPVLLLILFGERVRAREKSGPSKAAVLGATFREKAGAAVGKIFRQEFGTDTVAEESAAEETGTDRKEADRESVSDRVKEAGAERPEITEKPKRDYKEMAGKLSLLCRKVLSGLEGSLVIFSLLLSLAVVVGTKINLSGEPYFGQMTIADLRNAGIWFVLILTIGKLLVVIIRGWSFEIQALTIHKKWWLGSFLLLILLWSPYLLAYYPGILTPDSLTSLLQAKDLSLLYNHIPVAYTLLVALFARIGWQIGDANFGVFLFSLAQLLIMAGVLSYSAYWLRAKMRRPAAACIALLFYGMNPVIAMHSITMWKDVLFSAWIVLLCLFLFDMALGGGKRLDSKKGMRELCVLLLLVCFGRNNGLYVAVFCLGVLLIVYKDVRKKLLVRGGGLLLAVLLIQGPGYNALGINQSGFAESVGIPLQQISYTVIHDAELSEQDGEFLEKIIPVSAIEESYSPVSADNIKFNQEFNTAFFEENKGGFVKLYLKLLPAHLRSYTESYLLSTSGFWQIERTNWLVGEEVYENDMGIYNIDLLKEYFQSDWKEGVPDLITLMKWIPITNVGVMVWLVFFFIAAGFALRQRFKAFLAVPLIGCWITLMIATPVASQFRYVYYYHLMLPIVCILFFAGKEEL